MASLCSEPQFSHFESWSHYQLLTCYCPPPDCLQGVKAHLALLPDKCCHDRPLFEQIIGRHRIFGPDSDQIIFYKLFSQSFPPAKFLALPSTQPIERLRPRLLLPDSLCAFEAINQCCLIKPYREDGLLSSTCFHFPTSKMAFRLFFFSDLCSLEAKLGIENGSKLAIFLSLDVHSPVDTVLGKDSVP